MEGPARSDLCLRRTRRLRRCADRHRAPGDSGKHAPTAPVCCASESSPGSLWSDVSWPDGGRDSLVQFWKTA
jgi:hypothetical protein